MTSKLLLSFGALTLCLTSACGDPCVDDGFSTKKCNAAPETGSSASSESGTEDSSGGEGSTSDSSTTGTADSGTTDSGTTDSGTTDSGTTDSGTTDSGTTDSGTTDTTDTTDTSDTLTVTSLTATDTLPTTSGTTGNGMCTGTEQFEVDAGEATLDGWGSQASGLDQGDQIYPIEPDGTATFELDVPCEDTWQIWVLGWDQGTDDSFLVQVDGMPFNPAVFDLDCTDLPPGEGAYRWAHLNQRSGGGGGGCDVDNWWEVDLTGGMHELTFLPRESSAISRIIVTNDASFTP